MWVFCTGRAAVFLDDPAAALRFLQGDGARDLLIEDAELDPIRDRLPEGVVEVLRGRVERRTISCCTGSRARSDATFDRGLVW